MSGVIAPYLEHIAQELHDVLESYVYSKRKEYSLRKESSEIFRSQGHSKGKSKALPERAE